MSQALAAEAAKLRHEGRFTEAAAVYRKLLALRPDLAESWYNLAWVLRQTGKYDEALLSYQRALDAGVSGPEEVHTNRAVILSLLPGREAEVLAELQRALALNAEFVPALLNLGNFEEDRGRREEARTYYERVLEVTPGNNLALARLAGLRRSIGSDDPLISRLRAALDRRDTSPEDRADLGFALGRLLDASKDYGAAFSAYRAANEASRAYLRPGAPGYDRQAHEKIVDRIIDVFPRPVDMADTQRLVGQSPLFICGMFRSGSSLTEQILASHSQVIAGGELELLPALIRDGLQPYPEAAVTLDAAAAERLRLAYLRGLGTLAGAGQLVTDKRPDNFLQIGLIKSLFPDARIIYTRRNALDNILSIYFLHLDPAKTYALDLLDIAHWYREHQRLMEHWKTLYPADIFELDYDQLVREPTGVIAALLSFSGLEMEQACLSFHETPRSVRTASVWQVREPLYQHGSGRWRNYQPWLGALIDALRR